VSPPRTRFLRFFIFLKKKDETEKMEQNSQFRARPLPDFSNTPPGATLPATTKKTASAATVRKSTVIKSSVKESADEVKPFRARPLPKSTFVPPSTSPRPTTPLIPATPRSSSTSQPSTPRTTSATSSAKVPEKRSATAAAAANAKPFNLRSSARHEAYQKQLEEKRKQEEEESRKQALFHARAFNKSPAPEPRRSERHITAPQPFHLKSIARHEAQEEEKRRKLAQEEAERRRQTTFKAKPVPKTTYIYKAVSPRNVPMPSEVTIPSPSSGSRSPIAGASSSVPDEHVGENGTAGHEGERFKGEHNHFADDVSELAEDDLVENMMRLTINEGAGAN